jgi:methionine sulfoxide reductase heme-binding subunit
MTALLAASNNGKELWYLTRGSGTVALILLTASVLLGVMNSTRWRSARLPRFLVFGLHRNITLLALAFTVVHVVTTIVDSFAPIGVVDAFIPFLSPYRPFWLGLGTVAFDLLLALIVTSLLRRRIGVRAWKLVHWLAYASWPVALLHSLGTGSDARSGWLAVLGVICALTVLASVLWRVGAAPDALPAVRAGAMLATFGVLVGLLVWARGGPLQRGWASRAGTPASLIASAATRRSSAAGTAVAVAQRQLPTVSLPAGRFTSSFRGKLTAAPAGQGLVTVAIDGVARGGFRGRVHVALRGVPVEGGGVQMTDSAAGLLPTGAGAWYAGRVTGLDGTRILVSVSSQGRSVQVTLDLQISQSGRVTGSLRGSA